MVKHILDRDELYQRTPNLMFLSSDEEQEWFHLAGGKNS